MKTYELTSKATSNGIKEGYILRDGDEVTKIVQASSKEIDSDVKELQKQGYVERTSIVVQAFREASDHSGTLTEDQISIVDKLASSK